MYCERHVKRINRVCGKMQIEYKSALKAKSRSPPMHNKIVYSYFKLDYL
jgi:hypothetical protein